MTRICSTTLGISGRRGAQSKLTLKQNAKPNKRVAMFAVYAQTEPTETKPNWHRKNKSKLKLESTCGKRNVKATVDGLTPHSPFFFRWSTALKHGLKSNQWILIKSFSILLIFTCSRGYRSPFQSQCRWLHWLQIMIRKWKSAKSLIEGEGGPQSCCTHQAESKCQNDQCRCHSKSSKGSVSHCDSEKINTAHWQIVKVQSGPKCSKLPKRKVERWYNRIGPDPKPVEVYRKFALQPELRTGRYVKANKRRVGGSGLKNWTAKTARQRID